MPFWRRRKIKDNPLEGAERALAEAKETLAEVRSEREDVQRVSSFHRRNRLDNHWSQRVELLLKGER